MEQRTDRDGLAHHEQAVSTGWVQFRRRGTIGRTSDVAHLLGAFQAPSCRSLAAFGRVVGDGAASRGYIVPSGTGRRRTSTIQSVHCCKGLLGGGVNGHGVFDHFSVGSIGSNYPLTSALSMYNTSSSRSCLEWVAQRQEHLFSPHEQFPTKLFLLLEDTDLGEVLNAKSACSMISALPTSTSTRLRASTTERRRSCLNKWRNR